MKPRDLNSLNQYTTMKTSDAPFFTFNGDKIFMHPKHPKLGLDKIEVTAAVSLGMKIERGEKVDSIEF